MDAGERATWANDLFAAATRAEHPLAWRSLGLLYGRQDEPPALDLDALHGRPPAFGAEGWQLAEGQLRTEESRALRFLAGGLLQASQAIDPDTGNGQRLRVRTSDDATLDPLMEDVALVLVRRRLCALAGLPATHAEPFVVLRYRPGQEYRPHRDTLPPSTLADPVQGRGGQRTATVVSYLCPVAGGGETEFPRRGLRIRPVAGAALAFRNVLPDGRIDEDSLHAGLPVTQGEKWIATLWLRENPLRGF